MAHSSRVYSSSRGESNMATGTWVADHSEGAERERQTEKDNQLTVCPAIGGETR